MKTTFAYLLVASLGASFLSAQTTLLQWDYDDAATEPAGPVVFHSGEEPNLQRPWTRAPEPEGEGHFRFAILPDRAGGPREGILEVAVKRLNEADPDFVINVGDIIDGHSSRAIMQAQWREVDDILGELNAPFVFVPGDHETDSDRKEDSLWWERFGHRYYAFVYEDTLFVALNSRVPGYKQIGEAQRAWLADVLAAHADVRWTFVFMHHPLWIDGRNGGWREVEQLLADRPHTVYAGHVHKYRHYSVQGRDYVSVATAGGYSPLLGLEDGTLDHITLVEMGEGAPKIENRALTGESFPLEHCHRELNILERDLVNGWEIRPAALFTGPVFTAGTLPLWFKNNTPYPMTFSGEFSPEGDSPLRGPSGGFAVVVPPGSTAEKGVQVASMSPVPIEAAGSLQLTMTVTIADAEGATASQQKQFPVVAVQPLQLPLGMDADVSNVNVATPSGQAEVDFDVRTDGELVRVSFRVTDPYIDASPNANVGVLYHDVAPSLYNGDLLEIRFDARPEPDRARGNGWDRDGHIFFALRPPVEDRPGVDLHAHRHPAGVVSRVESTPGGYAGEVVVPFSYLRQVGGDDPDGFRLNLLLRDRREDGTQESAIWQPDWRSAGNIPGAGTFLFSL